MFLRAAILTMTIRLQNDDIGEERSGGGERRSTAFSTLCNLFNDCSCDSIGCRVEWVETASLADDEFEKMLFCFNRRHPLLVSDPPLIAEVHCWLQVYYLSGG